MVVAALLVSARASADPIVGACACDQPSCECEPPVHRFLILGWGESGWSRLSDVAPSGGLGVTFQFGQRLRARLHLVEEVDFSGYGSYSPDPTVREDHAALLVGIRWTPFHARRRDPSFPVSPYPMLYSDFLAFYVKASVGAGFSERSSSAADLTTWTPVASAALGYLFAQGRDWAFGFEAREQVAHFSEGFQRDWAILLVAQVSD